MTGGEAIADWLRMPNCGLKHLDLRWNMVRGESAQEIGLALGSNISVQHLLLAYNGFHNDGGEAIGMGLHHNTVLRRLDLSYNTLTPRAAFVVAMSLLYNEHLESLDLSGNPCGQNAGRALMRLPFERPKLLVDLTCCNLKHPDSRNTFDPLNPTGDHDLNLEVGR